MWCPGAGRTRNFGRNIELDPAYTYTPTDEFEVRQILERHADRPIRCRGALHSWSPLVATEGVLIDPRGLQMFELSPDRSRVRAGAGWTIEDLLYKLRPYGRTLPTLGVIKRQTISGATATGTHGSGKPSLSHFITRARIVHLDAEGRARVASLDGGDELLAARCSLGQLGVITQLELLVAPTYRLEESIRKYRSLGEALAAWEDSSWPLTQFALIPWSWTYLAYRRRESRAGGWWRRIVAWLWHLWLVATTDAILHALLKLMVHVVPDGFVRGFLRFLPKLVLQSDRVDASETILTINHHWFRHVEMELFVPRPALGQTLAQMRELVELAAGERESLSAQFAAELARVDMQAAAERLRGSYTLHYPLFVRRVEADDTLISMASPRDADAGERGDWTTIGIFTFRLGDQRYADFCRTVARCMMRLHGARLHWGKFFPISAEEARASHPRFERFEAVCRRYDPAGRFAYTFLDGRS